MPVISFTPADILRGKTLDAGWYGSEIVKVQSSTASKGDSINHTVTFLIEGTEGKEIERVFNTKALGFFIPLIAAVTGKQVKPEAFQFDTDELLHKKVDSKVSVTTYEGRLKNEVNEWVPYGKGRELQPF